MKKISLCLMAFLLCGCQFLQKPIPKELEENAVLHISIENKAYAKALETLWKQQYPTHAAALKFEIEPYHFQQKFSTDIAWVKDSDALLKLPYAAKLEQKQGYKVPKQLEREELHGIYQPIMAKGYLFAYEETALKEAEISVKELESFEKLQEKGKGHYQYSHKQEELLPLWISNLSWKDTMLEHLFQESEFLTAIENFQELYHAMSLNDEIRYSDVLQEGYAFGIVDPLQEQSQEAYQKGSLHFQKLPTWKKQELAPFADTYGFMVKKDCAYPQTAAAFLEMVRSFDGLQAFLDTSEDIPLLVTSDIPAFTIFDARKKEMIEAMNASRLYPVESIVEKPSVRYSDLLSQDLASMMQNGICANKKAELLQKEMQKQKVQWIKRQ